MSTIESNFQLDSNSLFNLIHKQQHTQNIKSLGNKELTHFVLVPYQTKGVKVRESQLWLNSNLKIQKSDVLECFFSKRPHHELDTKVLLLVHCTKVPHTEPKNSEKSIVLSFYMVKQMHLDCWKKLYAPSIFRVKSRKD